MPTRTTTPEQTAVTAAKVSKHVKSALEIFIENDKFQAYANASPANLHTTVFIS